MSPSKIKGNHSQKPSQRAQSPKSNLPATKKERAKRLTSAIGVFLLFSILPGISFLACNSASPDPTPNIPATVTAQVQQQLAAMPAPARVPTQTPAPIMTPTPNPTHTPEPTTTEPPTATHQPTLTPMAAYTPYPIPVSMPTPTPTRKATQRPWSHTAYWYRDIDLEQGLISGLQDHAPWVEPSEVRVATLDAVSESLERDLWFSLGCLGPLPLAYLGTYQGHIPDWAESHWYGFWSHDKEDWSEGSLDFYNPVITDDNGAIYISDRSQLRKILAILRTAATALPENHIFLAVIWPPATSDELGMFSELDPHGLDQVLQYLTCFEHSDTPPSPQNQTNTSVCDEILKAQFIFQRGADRSTRMMQVIEQVQTQRAECSADIWNPTVIQDSGKPFSIPVDNSIANASERKLSGCFPGTGREKWQIGGYEVPLTLRLKTTDGTNPAIRASAQDAQGNVLVYWSTSAELRPHDQSACWLYIKKDAQWFSNP